MEWLLVPTTTADTPGLAPPAGPPPGRDRHSAWTWRGDMYVFAGRSSVEDQLGRSDLWKLDPGHQTERVLVGGWGESIDDASTVFSRIDARSLQTPTHRSIDDAGASMHDNPNLVDAALCVVDVDVVVDAPHACLRDLRVWLSARGPRNEGRGWTFDGGNEDARALLFDGGRQPFRSGVRAGAGGGSRDSAEVDGCGDPNGGLLGTAFDDDAPGGFAGGADDLALSSPTGRDGQRQACTACRGASGPCQRRATRECADTVHGRCPVGFTDCSSRVRHGPGAEAAEGAGGPSHGARRPEEALSRFHGLRGASRWTLHVQDGSDAAQGATGTLRGWQLRLTLRPCEQRHVWTRVDETYGGAPSPQWPTRRFGHVAAVVGDDVFVWGGSSLHMLTDMWRLAMDADPSAMRWTPLRPSPGLGQDNYYGFAAPQAHGGALMQSPFRFLGFGGLREPEHPDGAGAYGESLTQYDPMSRAWAELPTTANEAAPLRRHRVNLERESWSNPRGLGRPRPRAHLAAVLVGASGTTSREAMGAGQGSPIASLHERRKHPRLLVFGGYDGTAALDDLWELRLGQIDYRDQRAAEDAHRAASCRSRLEGRGEKAWRAACSESLGLADDPVCSVDAIMTRAWCLGPGSAAFAPADPESTGGGKVQPAQAHGVFNF
jgi:hypothetical protein